MLIGTDILNCIHESVPLSSFVFHCLTRVIGFILSASLIQLTDETAITYLLQTD